MEWKDGRLQLPNVTLMAMTSVNVRQTIKAMQYSMRQIDFGDCVLITHRKPFFLPKGIRYAHTSKLTNIDCFNYKMLYELGDYIHTDFVMRMGLSCIRRCGGMSSWIMIISVLRGRFRRMISHTGTSTGICVGSATVWESAAGGL